MFSQVSVLVSFMRAPYGAHELISIVLFGVNDVAF